MLQLREHHRFQQVVCRRNTGLLGPSLYWMILNEIWCVIDLSFCHEWSLFCSLQFCIVIFEFACLMVQSIVCNHGRFNATPFIDSFQLKCSWKLSKLTESAQIGCEWTVSTHRVFSLVLWWRCQRLWVVLLANYTQLPVGLNCVHRCWCVRTLKSNQLEALGHVQVVQCSPATTIRAVNDTI